uniref:Uncharacterized protein n=1 Tax=Salix viminalis TaxID=40686 RepID=A0A6N2MY86_SALVM
MRGQPNNNPHQNYMKRHHLEYLCYRARGLGPGNKTILKPHGAEQGSHLGGEFPEKSVWNHHIRIVEWLKILCNSSMISQHSVINWPAILDMLSTKDRLIRRGRC